MLAIGLLMLDMSASLTFCGPLGGRGVIWRRIQLLPVVAMVILPLMTVVACSGGKCPCYIRGVRTFHDTAQGVQLGPNNVFCFATDGKKSAIWVT